MTERKTIGEVKGSVDYLGSCPCCRRQYLSRREIVVWVVTRWVCSWCADYKEAR